MTTGASFTGAPSARSDAAHDRRTGRRTGQIAQIVLRGTSFPTPSFSDVLGHRFGKGPSSPHPQEDVTFFYPARPEVRYARLTGHPNGASERRGFGVFFVFFLMVFRNWANPLA